MRKWNTAADLAAAILARANAKKSVRLSADTAYFVGLKLMTADARPTRDEVAMLLCDSRCQRPCCLCTGKANAVVRAYGGRVEIYRIRQKR